MHSLSPLDGSADAVRQADAAGANAALALERDLDRVSAALHAQMLAMAQHLNATLFAQSLLLVAYFVVLIGGWSLPLPGKHWLLAAIAGFAAVSLVLATIAVRSQTGRIGSLRARLKASEEALERIEGRVPVLSLGNFTSAMGRGALSLLPLAIVAGWAALLLYSLALPIAPPARPVAEARPEKSAVISSVRPAVARPTEKAAAVDAPAAEASEQPGSPLTSFLRAMQAPPTETDTIKP